MIIIKDKINYLEEISAAHTAANNELRILVSFLCRKIYALQYKGDYAIDFFGLPASENDAEPCLHWKSNNSVLDQLIIFFLHEYNTENQQR